ncbi:MAG: ATP-dependent DNA helicase RecG [Lachnospiraceae bacterium]|nr:ATP-dependent DNA helicase RecG [Lachnospiraceae bacterium]
MDINSSVSELKGVGEKTKKQLETIGVYTIRDILLHFPYNYIVFPEPVDVSEYEEDTTMAIRGELSTRPYNKGGRFQMVTATITDGQKKLPVVWFHMPYIRNTLSVGETYIFYGKVRNKNNRIVLEQPKVFHEDDYKQKMVTLQPVYHLGDGITNNAFTKLISQSVQFATQMNDFLSPDIKERRNLVDLNRAICDSHFPRTMDQLLDARKRLAFDEFFLFLLRLEATKTESIKTIYQMHGKDRVLDISKQLDFSLTPSQDQALGDILKDMSKDVPMQRLLQGDVGSGKTILAFLAMLYCSQNGYQSAFMAPTEVLAMQHYEKLRAFCEKHAPFTNVYLLTGSVSAANKKAIKRELSLDPTAIVVGTHALIVDDVDLPNLALVITDEQHRFGVRQRETLNHKGDLPHTLIMSATPIPRTLAIILYGDLDVSVMKESPKNRLPIKNCVVNKNYRKKAYEFIEKQIKEGHQAYIICPLVEESEAVDAVDVISYTKALKEYYKEHPCDVNIKITCLHGKMKPAEKNRIMSDFAEGKIHILISTTVIEVGVDVPNATVMMVENAERFGLAQLHQLRGRVGRGAWQSYCIFLDGKNRKEKNKRLEILNSSNDGFYIAEKDLELRGPGDIFGIKQSGDLDFKVADIYHDASLLKDASYEVKQMIEKDPNLNLPEHEILKQSINL